MLVFWSLVSLVRNSVVLAVYLLFSVACFFTVHEHYAWDCKRRFFRQCIAVLCRYILSVSFNQYFPLFQFHWKFFDNWLFRLSCIIFSFTTKRQRHSYDATAQNICAEMFYVVLINRNLFFKITLKNCILCSVNKPTIFVILLNSLLTKFFS